MTNREIIDQISVCYGMGFADLASEQMLNYKNYDIRLSMQFIRKIVDIVKPSDRQKFEMLLLKFEFESYNPFWSTDLYKIIRDGSLIFENIIDKYSGMLLEVDIQINNFLRYAKDSKEEKIRLHLNNLFEQIFQLLRHSRLLFSGDAGTYAIFVDRNKIYTISNIGKITLNKFEPGVCESELVGIWGKDRDINELDELIGFNTAYLRLFRKELI